MAFVGRPRTQDSGVFKPTTLVDALHRSNSENVKPGAVSDVYYAPSKSPYGPAAGDVSGLLAPDRSSCGNGTSAPAALAGRDLYSPIQLTTFREEEQREQSEAERLRCAAELRERQSRIEDLLGITSTAVHQHQQPRMPLRLSTRGVADNVGNSPARPSTTQHQRSSGSNYDPQQHHSPGSRMAVYRLPPTAAAESGLPHNASMQISTKSGAYSDRLRYEQERADRQAELRAVMDRLESQAERVAAARNAESGIADPPPGHHHRQRHSSPDKKSRRGASHASAALGPTGAATAAAAAPAAGGAGQKRENPLLKTKHAKKLMKKIHALNYLHDNVPRRHGSGEPQFYGDNCDFHSSSSSNSGSDASNSSSDDDDDVNSADALSSEESFDGRKQHHRRRHHRSSRHGSHRGGKQQHRSQRPAAATASVASSAATAAPPVPAMMLDPALLRAGSSSRPGSRPASPSRAVESDASVRRRVTAHHRIRMLHVEEEEDDCRQMIEQSYGSVFATLRGSFLDALQVCWHRERMRVEERKRYIAQQAQMHEARTAARLMWRAESIAETADEIEYLRSVSPGRGFSAARRSISRARGAMLPGVVGASPGGAGGRGGMATTPSVLDMQARAGGASATSGARASSMMAAHAAVPPLTVPPATYHHHHHHPQQPQQHQHAPFFLHQEASGGPTWMTRSARVLQAADRAVSPEMRRKYKTKLMQDLLSAPLNYAEAVSP